MELNRKEAFTQLFILIYQHDTKALERDLLKCIVLQTEDFQPSPKERVNLMRWLWSSVQYIYKDFDYSELLDKVRELNELHDTMASYIALGADWKVTGGFGQMITEEEKKLGLEQL